MSNATILSRINSILAEYKPCRIEVDRASGQARCCGVANGYRPCCTGCRHLGARGCTVDSIACKFYFCKWAWDNLPVVIQEEVRELLLSYEGYMKERFDGWELTPRYLAERLGEVPFSYRMRGE